MLSTEEEIEESKKKKEGGIRRSGVSGRGGECKEIVGKRKEGRKTLRKWRRRKKRRRKSGKVREEERTENFAVRSSSALTRFPISLP